jgi:DNA-binding NarL/FixJ family response regulator
MGIRVLVVDDHEVIRAGIASMLTDTDIEIVAEADSGEEGIRLAAEIDPDVVLLDVRLPGIDGLATLGQMRISDPKRPVVILSTYDNPTFVARSIALGANGYVLKGCGREELIHAIRTAAAGETVWSREDLRRITGALTTPRLEADVDVPLTQRESEVLRQLALGQTNKEIGHTLHISYETVKEHVQHILQKLGVSDRTQASIWAVRKGLV